MEKEIQTDKTIYQPGFVFRSMVNIFVFRSMVNIFLQKYNRVVMKSREKLQTVTSLSFEE